MPTIRLPLLHSALLCAGCLAASPAGAGELHRWVTPDGTVAYTDDARRVPEAFRARAVRTRPGSLGGYARLTPADEAAQARSQERLAERLERLRALNAMGEELAGETPELAPGPEPALGGFALRSPRRIEERRRVGTTPNGQPVYRRTSRTRTVDEPQPQIAFAVDPSDPAPVVVERRRVLDGDTGITRHVTVVEQGERVLGVIKPRVHGGPPYRELEEELERP